ncbi:proton-coupled folate transporter-like [Ruditapes philippinarum]|uniref:proton-coupled folate transporter-like n=1 Tax=Ruditapes philippinarum TaxID=129788 RepID=UPI00295A987E|nr:proton-coupled folate transporter-like [Ruditapes philippinarum]XP_060586669.1 proton-coupled folate transporter-like [Ruditapes philippinarum]XP_060586670.1 proton-coupled folate transporter-like [Ruditapes philippinarum]XP_060586671.1 proton-coupled folate transporter-like [Ruditapes philippinarum]XP_060586672.1 proton-coupled folate transporter-like [Ruditapes philippinarum]XP_060586673.1 proton-coupled folate transporter-like [Ruditapes philippinarum]
MEGQGDNCIHGSSENTPLLVEETGSGTVTGTEHCQGEVNQTSGFTLKHLMIVPMCACYFIAGCIYLYIFPQYIQKVMENSDVQDFPHKISPHVPHVIFSQRNYVFQSQEQTVSDGCSNVNKSDEAYKKFDHIQQETAKWIIYFNISVLIPAMLANLIWASFSDVLGRKFAMFLCLASMTIRLTIFTFVVYFKLSLVYALIGNFIDGLAGSYTSLFAILFSYVSDITCTGKQRTIAIVVVELVIGLSFTASSIVSGHLIDQFGFFYPSMVNSIISAVGILILLFLVPETMQRDRTERQVRPTVWKSLAESFRFYFCDGTKIKRVKYVLLMLSFFFMGIPAMSRMSIEVLYQLGRPFCWSPTKIGWFGAIKMIVASLFGIGSTYIFKRCVADDTIAFYSLILTAAGYVVEGLAKTDFALYSGKYVAVCLFHFTPFPNSILVI